MCACAFSPLARSGGLASRDCFGAPHVSFGCFVLLLCSALSGLGLPYSCPFVCPPPFLFFSLVSLLLALPVSPALCGFQPRMPLALALCVSFPPPLFGFFAFLSFCPCFLSWALALFAFFFLGFWSAPFVLAPPPPPALLSVFVSWGSSPRCSALLVLPLLLCVLPGLWLPPPAPPPPPLLLVCVSRVSPPCCSVLRFLPLLLCSCLPSWRSSAVVADCCPRPAGMCVVLCAVWCCRAAPAFCLVFCCGLMPCSALHVVLWFFCLVLLWADAHCAVFSGTAFCV